jgi:transposase
VTVDVGLLGTVCGMAYSSDLTDEQWALLEPVFNTPGKRGPKHAPDLRRVVDAMLYISHTGCQWRFLPESFGPWTLPWDDEVNDLVKSYRKFHPDGDGRHGNDADEQELLRSRGVQDLTGDSVDIALSVPDGETYWRWLTSHGAGTFAKRLPDEKRGQLYRDNCDLIARSGGWTVRRSAAIWQGTKA